MQGFNKGFKPKSKRVEGKIRGPGTGTSDDIKAQVPEGSYIMPADSTQAIGEQNLAGMGAPVDVNVSNGEFALPPEQVHAVGVQALNQMRDQTHTPTGQPQVQGSAERPDLFFADGGPVEDPRRRTSQSRALVPVSQPAAAAPAAPQASAQPNPGTMYTNSSGQTGRGFMPSSSRAVVPAGPVTTHQPGRSLVPAGPVVDQPRPEGIDARTREQVRARAQADSANWQQQRAAQDARFAGAQSQSPQPPKVSAVDRGRGFVNKAGRAGAFLSAIPAVVNAWDDDATERYAKRFGMSEPSYDGSALDIGKAALLRGLGFASDVGSTMTFGLADRLYRDKQEVDTGMLAGSTGAVAGGVAGNRTGNLIGRGIDGVLRGVTRGRYTGNYGERVGTGFGTVVGAGTGAGAARSIEEQLTRDPSQIPPNQYAQGADVGAGEDSGQQPVAQSGAQPLTNNIIRDGNSFSAAGPIREGYTINGEAPASQSGPRSPQNEAAVQALMARTPEFGQGAGAQAAMADAGRGFQPGGSRVTVVPDSGRLDSERRRAFAAASTAHPGAQNGQLTAAQINAMRGLIGDERTADNQRYATDASLTREEMSQAGADRRAASRDAIDLRRVTGEEESRGFQTRAAARVERLYEQYEQASTPEEKSAIAEQLRVLSGDSQAPRFAVAAGGQIIDPTTQQLITQPAQIFNTQTGEFVQQQAALPPLAENPAVQQILQDTSLSREERARRIRALGYQ